jgi:hypothetical protein
MARASSTPVGPAPTMTKFSSHSRCVSLASNSSSSRVSRSRRLIAVASSSGSGAANPVVVIRDFRNARITPAAFADIAPIAFLANGAWGVGFAALWTIFPFARRSSG